MPDHSTLSKNRHGRFRESDLLRRVFETVLRRCIRESPVGGEGFAVDASLIKADANRQKGIEGDKDLPPDAGGRAVEEYLAVLDDAAFWAATDDINETDAGGSPSYSALVPSSQPRPAPTGRALLGCTAIGPRLDIRPQLKGRFTCMDSQPPLKRTIERTGSITTIRIFSGLHNEYLQI